MGQKLSILLNLTVTRVTTNLTEPYSLTRRPFFIKNLTEPYNSTFFIMTLQNLTEEVLQNFTHKEHENVSFFKKSRLRPSKQSYYVYTPKLFRVRPPTLSLKVNGYSLSKKFKIHKNNWRACKMMSQNLK